MAKVTTIPLAELVEDLTIYPRHAVDDANVQSLALALEAGHELPPIVVCSKTKRVADGWHRCRAYRRIHGPGATVPVTFRDYKTEAELVEDAIRLNAAHGRRMDSIDQTRAVLMLERYGLASERIALALHVPEARVEKLRLRVATARVATDQTVPGTRQITLKRCVSHLAGTQLTREQAEAHESAPGTSYLLIAKQLRDAIRTGLADREDERLVAMLAELHAEIDSLIASVG